MTESRWVAPGRVNLIGEHTDYNHGLALPFAIPQGCRAHVRTGVGVAAGLVARSAQSEEPVRADSVDEVASLTPWARYVLGPAWALASRGVEIPPLEVHVDSDVPSGAGLSSSAAVVCSVTTAMIDALGVELGPDELLAVTRQVENDVVGAPTGGLDQMASLRCREGHALLCDFDDLSTRDIPLDVAAHGLAFLVIDTGVAHQHSDGGYAARRAGCEQTARVLGIESLRAVAADGLPRALDRLETEEQRRCLRHVVTENQRVRDVVDLLEAGRVEEIGPLLSASHHSLRDDYAVTVPELDVAQEVALRGGAHGARMTGGGFGGCVIALVGDDRAEAVTDQVAQAFAGQGWSPPRSFVVTPAAGAHRVES